MSDFSGIEISDVVGLSKPITKLIETVSGALGKVYEPIHIKRMAKAKAAEIKLLGEAVSSNNLLPIKYDGGNVIIDGTDFSELAKRTQSRLLFQELKKQNNIDQVVGYAAEELSKVNETTSKPVDKDWTTRFFNSVSDVSSEEMQQIWGKILAGEINNPGSFSLRTLETVRNISKEEAQLFEKIVPYIVSIDSDRIITSNNDLLHKYDIPYREIMILGECGLLNSSSTLVLSCQLNKEQPRLLFTRERIAFMSSTVDENLTISIGAYALTLVGKQLYSIMNTTPNNEYFIDLAKKIELANAGKISINVHSVYGIEDGIINFDEKPLDALNSNM